MAVIVEDGTGVANANSYGTRVEANAYHAARPTAARWAAISDDDKDANLIFGTEFLDASYEWDGETALDDQELRFPRECMTDRDGREIAADSVPTQIKRALFELALLLAEGAGVGGSFGSVSNAGGAIKRVKAGSAEVEYQPNQAKAVNVHASNALPDGAAEYLDRILTGLFLSPAGVMVKLSKS